MANSINFSKKTIAVITGASKGIGRSIAIELSRRLHHDSIVVLVARSKEGLDETKSQIQEIDKSLTIQTYVIDLSKPDETTFNNLFKQITTSIDTTGIEFGIIFHNAGFIGTMKQTLDLTDLKEWRTYFDLNLFSAVLLNGAFVKHLRPLAPQLVVVNVTSICGRVPTINLAMYGAGKASRDLFFQVLAVEEPNLIVLNYSPGPVDTDMFHSIVTDAQSEEARSNFKKVKETSMLKPVQTVAKMLDVLENGDFKSGDVVDYFDRI